MFASERHNLIVNTINNKESVTVKELSNLFNVSEATIRNDLNFLDEEKLIERTHGGAVSKKDIINNIETNNYELRKNKNKQYKSSIAKAAFSFIEKNDYILLDASSTCYELAKIIAKSKLDIVVMTNGINTANLLKENLHLTVILIGGVIRGESNAIEGSLGAAILDNFQINKIFFSASGVSSTKGFSDFNMNEVQLKRKMIEISEQKIALVDSSKLNADSNLIFFDGANLDTLITNADDQDDLLDQYKEKWNVLTV